MNPCTCAGVCRGASGLGPDWFCALDFIAARRLPDGRILAVVPLTFGRARLTLGRDLLGYDRGY